MSKIKIVIQTFWKERISPLLKAAKEGIGKVLKICFKAAIRIVAAAVLTIIFVIPFLSKVIDHKFAQWLWYPACALYIMLLIADRIRRKEPVFKEPIFDFYSKVGEALVLPVFTRIFVFNY